MGDTVADFNDRADFDAVAVWQIRNLGFGEQAARESACAEFNKPASGKSKSWIRSPEK